MIYFKAFVIGLATACVACLLWILVTVVLPLAVPLLRSRVIDDGTGAVGVGFVSVSSGSILLVCVAGFVAGCWWTLRRPRRMM
jgi:hypothetical protein